MALYVVAAVEHLEITAIVEFGEGEELALFLDHQGVTLRHALVPDGGVRDHGRPGVKLLCRIIRRIHHAHGLVKQRDKGLGIVPLIGPDMHDLMVGRFGVRGVLR